MIGLILVVPTGTVLDAAFEGSMDSRPLTPRERRWALGLVATGALVGLTVFVYVPALRQAVRGPRGRVRPR